MKNEAHEASSFWHFNSNLNKNKDEICFAKGAKGCPWLEFSLYMSWSKKETKNVFYSYCGSRRSARYRTFSRFHSPIRAVGNFLSRNCYMRWWLKTYTQFLLQIPNLDKQTPKILCYCTNWCTSPQERARNAAWPMFCRILARCTFRIAINNPYNTTVHLSRNGKLREFPLNDVIKFRDHWKSVLDSSYH